MKKIKYTVIGGAYDDLHTENRIIQDMRKYNYLDVRIRVDGKNDEDILKKVAKRRPITRELHSNVVQTSQKDKM